METMAINGERERPFLPEEIIINILKRLPVKSLMRFQCVCKHWKNLFKTPSFIQHHLRHSTHQNSSLVIGPDGIHDAFYLLLFNLELQFREFENAPFTGSLVGLSIVGSSNGLLCFADWSKRPAAPLLWNPATREVRKVPIIPNYNWNWGCDFGFGFCHIINDYRIVRFSLEVGMVEVYSLSTGCWKNIQFESIKGVCICGHGVNAHGVIFWPGTKYTIDTRYSLIISFDLVTEVFTVIPWPAFVSDAGRLAVYDDKLAIISYCKTKSSGYSSINLEEKDKEDYCSLYFEVMNEGALDSSWERWSSSEKYIGNSELPLYDGTIWRNQIVSIDGGTLNFTEIGMENTERLYLIDVIANEYKKFDIPRPKYGYALSVFNYAESPEPVGGNIEIEEP